jgi:ribosomal protein S18 acetylase RimI-like enzyme
MGSERIELLDHHSEAVAIEIYDVFQLSYQVEANIVGVEDFPPLRRSESDIQLSRSQFLGLWITADLAALVEYRLSEDHLSIDSLVVHPQYFRRGFASQLLQWLLDNIQCQTADVETAAANDPAIALYEKLGFAESNRWTSQDGIEKTQLLFRQ